MTEFLSFFVVWYLHLLFVGLWKWCYGCCWWCAMFISHNICWTIAIIFQSTLNEEAHIAWALNCVKSGYSDNSADYFGNVLRCICPNDKVPDISNGRKKLMFVVNYGLFSYFNSQLKIRSWSLHSFIWFYFDLLYLMKTSIKLHRRMKWISM